MLSDLQLVGRRLEKLNNLIKDKFSKDIWIINQLEPKFIKMIHHQTSPKEENLLTREINLEINTMEWRFGQKFENKAMNNRLLIREAIIELLEEDTKFSEGDAILTSEGDKGVITLSKHPFYAAKLDDTGVTHSYHYTDIQPDPDAEPMDFGKYDVEPKDEEQHEEPLQESSPSEIIHIDGLLTVKDDLNITDVLSDIRSITGITVVRSIDIPGESHKNKLKIKIDPYPFQGIDEDVIKQKIKTTIRKIPGVKEFWSGVIQEPLQEKKFKIKDPK